MQGTDDRTVDLKDPSVRIQDDNLPSFPGYRQDVSLKLSNTYPCGYSNDIYCKLQILEPGIADRFFNEPVQDTVQGLIKDADNNSTNNE